MPTPINATEKSNYIALVATVDPIEATRLSTILVYYDDIVTAIRRQLDTYAANPAYLKESLDIFVPHNAALLAAGIYYNSFTSGQLTDPKVLVKYNANGGIASTATDACIILLNSSTATITTVSTTKNLQYFYIGPGCTVDQVDSTASGSFVNNIYLPFIKNRPATLRGIKYGSFYSNIEIGHGSVYGGVINYNPANSCTSPVTSLAVGIVTHNSIELTWTPPASGYTAINAYYRRTDSGDWIRGTNDDGNYSLDTGFIFTDLEPDTSYDFKVTTVCNNGGIANVYISGQTTCCSGGNADFVTCPILVTINTLPDPAQTQTLCNGVVIYKQYAPGATLQILKTNGTPLLANGKAPVEITVDNVPYQDFPFIQSTGTLNAAATPLTTFVNGNTITSDVVIPA